MLASRIEELNREIDRLKVLEEKISTYVDSYGDIEEITDIKKGELFFYLISSYSAQKKAPLAQTFISNIFEGKEIPPSENRGDFVYNDSYVELKCSFRNQAQMLNLRQIRPWQPVDYYFCFYIDDKEIENSQFYVLTKEEMLKEVELCGSATHGTSKANENN